MKLTVQLVIVVLIVGLVQENCYGKVLLRDNRYWRTARDLRLVFSISYPENLFYTSNLKDNCLLIYIHK